MTAADLSTPLRSLQPIRSSSCLIDLRQILSGLGPAQCALRLKCVEPGFGGTFRYGLAPRRSLGGVHGQPAGRHHQELGRHLDLSPEGEGNAGERRGSGRDHGRPRALSLARAPGRLHAFHRPHERRRRHHGRHEGHESHPALHRRHGDGRGRRLAHDARLRPERARPAALHHHRDRQHDHGRHGLRRHQGLVLPRRLRPGEFLCHRRAAGDAARRDPRDQRGRQSEGDAAHPLELRAVRHHLRGDHQGPEDHGAVGAPLLAEPGEFPQILPHLQGARLRRDVLHLPLCEARRRRAAQGQSRGRAQVATPLGLSQPLLAQIRAGDGPLDEEEHLEPEMAGAGRGLPSSICCVS